jgi:hypothetical protein
VPIVALGKAGVGPAAAVAAPKLGAGEGAPVGMDVGVAVAGDPAVGRAAGTVAEGRSADVGVGNGGSVIRGAGAGDGVAIVGVGVGDGRGAGVSAGGPIISGVGVGAGCRRKSATCALTGAASKATEPARRRTWRFIWLRVFRAWRARGE